MTTPKTEWSRVYELLETVITSSSWQFALIVIVVLFMLLFRGAIQPVMIEQLGVGRGIAFTSLQNGLAVALGTLNPWALVPSTVNAAVLGILRHSSGSLYPSLALHAVSGLATLLASYGTFGIGGFDDTSEAHTSLAWLLPAAVFTGIGLRLCKTVAAAPPPSQETDPV